MEFTSLQIAKLVLGYLKKEKCHATVLAFCDASPHLKHFSETIRNRRKFFITRVNGLSLVDYLTEYAVIYTLVQERLEDTDYFEERRSKNLVDELRYLLDANGRQNRENSPTQSRSSTPMRELHKERERLYFPKNLSVIKEASACDTTPLESLPGNSNDGAPNKVLRCTKPSSPPRSRKSDENGESDSEDSPDKFLELEEDDLSMQMLTQTLLEHHELHEKIAENINLFRSTTEAAAPVASTEERISSGVLQELDSAIKAIVQKTEADPIFEKLIGEIIGNVGETTTDEEQTDGKKNDKNAGVLTKSVQDQESGLATPVLQTEENSLKQRPTDPKKQSSERRTNDDQENVALNFPTNENPSAAHPIQSSNPAEVNENVPISDPTKINIQQNLTVNTTTGEIILYDGTLDNFMKTSSAAVSHPSNPLVYNSGLLMVQPSVPALMPAVGTLQVNQNKPCYMWNGSQLLNVSVPQLKVNNITEQDILTMPTVIVCDDNQQGILNNLVAPATTSQQLTLPQKKFVNIAPRVDKTVDNISEFLTLYQCNDSNDSCSPQKIQDLKPRVKTKKKIRKAVQKTSTLSAIHVEVLNPVEEVPLDELKVEAENRSSASPERESKPVIEAASDAEKAAESNMSASKTPELVKKNSERQRSLSTPKSGSLSHVRALDFNFGTPGKPSKETTSPKSARKRSRKSPKTSTTKISKSLFGTPTKIQKAERDKTVDVVDKKEDVAEKSDVAEIATAKDEIKKARNSWDSDLRALTGPMSDRCPTPKRKRKDSLRNRKSVKRIKIEIDPERVQPSSSTESVDGLKKPKDKLKRKPKTGVKDATTPNIIIKNKPPPTTTTEKPDKIIKTEEDSAKATNPVEMPEAPADVNYTKDCETNDVPMVSEMPFSLINCNAKARYKRKCNIDNNLKKEVKITKVKEVKSLEFTNDGSNKLILSPSKLNANKRTLVENIDEKDAKLQCPIEDESKKFINDMVVIEQNVLQLEKQTITEEKSKNKTSTTELVNSSSTGETPSKFITPEMQKDALIQHPVISKRNITPILETPMKMVMSQCPKTPGLLSPVNNTDTPFTKVFKEQLHGVDISCIQTPKFPLTPNFPFTPTMDGVSPYPERPSDYSTSSSYYQPSDAEQNKSLEQLMIDECKRLENRKDTPVKINVQEDDESPTISVVDDKGIQKPAENVAEVNESEQDLKNKAIVDKMKALSSNIIARKNLSLMDEANMKSDDSSCTSSSSDDDSESSDGGSDDSMWNSTNNETIVQKSKSEMTISSRYNLRSRRGNVLTPQKEISGVAVEADNKTTEVIQQIIAEIDIKPTLESNTNTSTLSNHQEKVLQEMEQKRQRMIAKLKDDQIKSNIKSKEKASEPTADSKRKKLKCDEKTPKAIKKPVMATRETNGRFIKGLKTVSRDASKSAVKKPVNRRKSKLPKKILLNVNGTNAAETSAPPTNPQEKFPGEAEGVRFHLSSDSECTKLEPFDLVETELRECSTSSAPLPLCKIPESHPLKNFHLVLETITTIQNEKNKESNSDQEAESLVKGLKERGIYLIHNKSPKKQDKAQDDSNRIDSHEPEANQNGKSEDLLQAITKTDNARDNSEGHCEMVNNRDHIHSQANQNDKSEDFLQAITETENARDNSEGHCDMVNNRDHIRSQANDKKDELRKNVQTSGKKDKNHKANESLEEGEILSEEERANAEVQKSAKPKHSESHRDYRRRYFAERKPIKQYRSTLLPRKSYSSSTSKSKVERTKSASSKSKVESKPSVISKSKAKDEITPKKDIDTEKIPPEIASVNRILDDLNLPNSIGGELAFDVMSFPRENLRLVYDESKTCNKEMRQYDSELLYKKIAAKVYIESADAEIEKFMTVTPLDFILDIPDGFSYKSTGSKVKILDCVTLHAKRDAKDLSTASPLDNLYEPETSSRYETKILKYKKAVHTSSSARRKSVDQKPECLKNSAAARQSRSKSVDQKMLLTFSVTEKKNVVYKQGDKSKLKSTDREKRVTTKDVSQIKQKKAAATTKDNKKQSADVKNSLSCSGDCKVSTSTEAVASSDKKVEVLRDLEETSKETGKIAEIIEKVTDDNVTIAENDDLMNYAICGSERAENIEEGINKQKVNENELLSKLDVDVFLSKLHGE